MSPSEHTPISKLPPEFRAAVVHVVTQDSRVRGQLRNLLRAALAEPVVLSASEADFARQCDPEEARCVVVPITPPDMELLGRIRAIDPVAPIIAVATAATPSTVFRALKLGATDFLVEPFANPDALLASVRGAWALPRNPRPKAVRDPSVLRRLGRLTDRERQILSMVVAGRSIKQIAYALGLSIKTVQTHRAQIGQKTGAKKVVDLVKLAVTLSDEPFHRGAAE